MRDKATHAHLRRVGTLYTSEPLYFITTCTADRQPFLADPAVVRILTDEWQQWSDRHQWCVGSFVIMPDHVHFFCRSANSTKSLPDVMSSWKQWTSKRLSRELNVTNRIWQAGFFDHILRSEESYAEKWRYVRDNPVRAKLVLQAENWPFTGHVHFA